MSRRTSASPPEHRRRHVLDPPGANGAQQALASAPMRRPFVALIAMLIAAVLQAAPARASGASGLYTRVLHAYQANGRIPPCEFSSPQLESALSSVDTYGQQYYADFIYAIQTALTARASGACSGAHHPGVSAAGNPNRGSGSSGQIPGAPALPASVTASTRSGLPLPMVLLIVLGALLAALAGLAGWARTRGWTPGWAPNWRHGAAEARYRTEGAWLQFRERLRR